MWAFEKHAATANHEVGEINKRVERMEIEIATINGKLDILVKHFKL